MKGSFCHGWDDEKNHYGEGFITSDPSLGTTGESQNDHCQATSKIDRYDGANRFLHPMIMEYVAIGVSEWVSLGGCVTLGL